MDGREGERRTEIDFWEEQKSGLLGPSPSLGLLPPADGELVHAPKPDLQQLTLADSIPPRCSIASPDLLCSSCLQVKLQTLNTYLLS